MTLLMVVLDRINNYLISQWEVNQRIPNFVGGYAWQISLTDVNLNQLTLHIYNQS